MDIPNVELMQCNVTATYTGGKLQEGGTSIAAA